MVKTLAEIALILDQGFADLHDFWTESGEPLDEINDALGFLRGCMDIMDKYLMDRANKPSRQVP
jgi:hypothetical protein